MSDFWLKKMKTYFKRIDIDKDGKITRHDFEAMSEKFAKSPTMSDHHKEQLEKTLTTVWDRYLIAAGGTENLGEKDFLECMQVLVEDRTLKKDLEGPLPLFFRAVDANDDGFINEEEYGQFFKTLGIDQAMAPASFKAIDENGDNLISLEEFKHAGTEFFLERKDESKPSKLFWGPLI